MTSTFERYHEAASRLDALIDMTPTPTDTSREAVRQRAEVRMERLLRFLARLGNPHEGRPLIHVGGTSGKGSTSTAMAAAAAEQILDGCVGEWLSLDTVAVLQPGVTA